MKIKHKVRILKLDNTHFEIYQCKYILKLIPYWKKLSSITIKDFDKDFNKEVYKYADKLTKQVYPHILEIKHKK